MPTLDGIVVTEPQEIEVYTFNRNDIKNIAKESIEQADKLELNPSGTFRAFENIVDKDGHKRFEEWDITTETISGVSLSFHKVSLSGSHLLIVLFGTITNGTVISNGAYYFKNLMLPQWILDKIYPLYSEVVVRTSITYYGGTDQNANAYLYKGENGLSVNTSGFTANADKTFRIAFDLLID